MAFKYLPKICTKKPKCVMLFVCLAAVIIVQYFMFRALPGLKRTDHTRHLILGVHPMQMPFYEPSKNQFKCIRSMETISFEKINDDYCDCKDGSDEPGTNACANGRFFCSTQVVVRNFPKNIPSYRVNDGICDCCDGSDEYLPKKTFPKYFAAKQWCDRLC